MASRDEDFGADLTLTDGDVGIWSPSGSARAREPRDWRSLYEQAHARAERERSRADAAEARAEELRWAEVDSRSRTGSLESQLDTCRNKLKAAVEELKNVRRAAGDALSLQAEVTRLEKLLADAGVESSKHSTITSLRKEVARLRTALQASEAPTDIPKPLSGTNARLGKALKRSQAQNDTIKSLRMEIAKLRKQATVQRKADRATQTSLSRESARLRKALERSQEHEDTIKSLRRQIRSLNYDIRELHRNLEGAESHKATIRRQFDELIQLNRKLSDWRSEQRVIRSLCDRLDRLDRTLAKTELDKMLLELQLARRRADKELLPEFRKVLRRSRRHKTTIKSLRMENARLRKTVKTSHARIERLEAQHAKLRASTVVLQKALFGSRSEQQERARSERPRGQQPGTAGHGRTQRPALEEKTEEHNPPKNARMCSCCGKPYAANGERSSTIIEIEVKAHTRRIVRPRWRRTCDCASSPLEISAPPVPRLFPRTPYGTSVWACVLFERYACLRPLHRVSTWMSDQGLPISVGTLADSVPRFLPLFEPFDEAILSHQNEAAVRHGDETSWRIQSLRETGRSSRAWLWTSVSHDAVYFHIDPSRSAKVAHQLFGAAACILFLVCDRLSSYKTMARELGGAVILCWCWAHQRRDFIHGAAGQVRLTHWCQRWIERIASIYRLNDARLEHYDPGLKRQTTAFAQAQGALEVEVERLFADAEQELAVLPAGARETKALRSLLNHRSGLSVFVDKPEVPMDNNAAERALRGPVIGRRLSFGSDGETGARFTALLYSVVATLKTNGIDVRRWLEAWLTACAKNGRRPPDDLSPWLPWSMSEERRRALMAPG